MSKRIKQTNMIGFGEVFETNGYIHQDTNNHTPVPGKRESFEDYKKTSLPNFIEEHATEFFQFLKVCQKLLQMSFKYKLYDDFVTIECITEANDFINSLILCQKLNKQNLHTMNFQLSTPIKLKNITYENTELERTLNLKHNDEEHTQANNNYASKKIYENKRRNLSIPKSCMKNVNFEQFKSSLLMASKLIIEVRECSDSFDVLFDCKKSKFFRKKKVREALTLYCPSWDVSHRIKHVYAIENSTPSFVSSDKNTNFTIFKYMSKNGLIDYNTASRFIYRLFDNENEATVFANLLKTIKKNCRKNCKVEMDSSLTKSDVFLKHKDVDMSVYYSDYIINAIKSSTFDVVFCDGTHLKQKKNFQIIIIRLYSQTKKTIFNAMFCLTEKKNTETYKKLFEMAFKIGILSNVQYFVSDFELAFRNGFESAVADKLKQRITYRVCYYHFVKNLRAKLASIRKIANKAEVKTENTIPFLHVIFSFLYFVNEKRMMFFKFLVSICREISNSVANDVFYSYVEKVYIKKNYGDILYADVSLFQVTTNNTVEGTNSSLKKFTNGDMTMGRIYEWMLKNTRSKIVNPKTVNFKLKEYYRDFHSSFISSNFTKVVDCMKTYMNALKSKKEKALVSRQKKLSNIQNKTSKGYKAKVSKLDKASIELKTNFAIWHRLDGMSNVNISDKGCSFKVKNGDKETHISFSRFCVDVSDDINKLFKEA